MSLRDTIECAILRIRTIGQIRFRRLAILPLIAIATFLSACGDSSVYTSKGTIINVSDDKKTIVLRHEDFKDSSGRIHMQGMTMEFKVKNPEILKGISHNDIANVELTESNQDEWISKLVKTGHNAAADAEDATRAKSNTGEPLLEGQPVPDFELTNQDNKSVKLSDFHGKPVVITFVYTRCPFPDMCPRLTSNFAEIQKELAPKYGNRFELLSITLDPANDTPAVLKEYATRENRDLTQWNFLTGKDEDIRKVAHTFNVDYWTEDKVLNHTMSSAIIRPDGTLMKVYYHADWKPEDVIADVTRLLN